MKFKYLFLLSYILIFSSCRMGKDYKRPELNLPGKFRNIPLSNDTSYVWDVRGFFKNQGLLALIDTAVKHNSDLLIAVKNITSAEAALKKVKLNYLPELTGQLTGNHTISSKNSLAGVGNEQFIGSRAVDDYTASLGFSWEIDIWGRIRKEKEEALAIYMQTLEAKKAVRTKLVADLANGYYNLLMLDEQLLIAQQNRDLSDSTVKVIVIQYKVGEASSLGLQQAKAQLETTRQLIPQIEQSIALQENALSLLCGTYANSISRKIHSAEEFGYDQNDAYPVSVLSARPDIRMAEFALRAANAQTGITQAAMYPALAITASGGLNAFKASNWFTIPGSLFGTVAGGITQPIFQRGRLKTQYRLSLIEREKAVITFRQSVLQGYAEVSDALISKEKLDEQYLAASNREKELEAGIQTAGILFKTGMANYLEIITANNNYLQSRLQKVQLSKEKAAARIELYRALGGGWQ